MRSVGEGGVRVLGGCVAVIVVVVVVVVLDVADGLTLIHCHNLAQNYDVSYCVRVHV